MFAKVVKLKFTLLGDLNDLFRKNYHAMNFEKLSRDKTEILLRQINVKPFE